MSPSATAARPRLRRSRTGQIAACALALACFPAAAGPGGSYAESSSGLDTPELEGGYTEFEMVDVDDDGHVDLVSVGDHGSPFINSGQHGVMVWFGDGLGNWSVFQSGEFGYGGIAVGDVNGDGLQDVGYGVHHDYSATDLGDQIQEVALGDGSGRSWTAWDDGLAGNGETWGMFGTDFADVDGDGDLDLGSVSFGCCAGLHVYLNRADGSWVQSFGFLDGNSRQEFVFGDVDNDGWPDIATSHQSGTVWIGDGRGGFAAGDGNLPPAGFLGRVGPALGDVDGDGGDDLAWIDGSGAPRVWARDAGGTWNDFSGSLPTSGDWSAAQLWDLDGDGVVDLAAFGDGRFDSWKGDGAGGWSPLASFTTPAPGAYAAFRVGGDADHNGYPDVVIVAEEGSLFNSQNHLRFFKETTVPSSLRARIVKPGPARLLRTGTVRFIHWAAEIPPGESGTVRIELSTGGPGGPWLPVADGLPDNGRHQWVVPDLPGSDDLRLRLTVTTASGSAEAVTAAPLVLRPGHDTLELRFADADTLEWSDRMVRGAFNLYRGDWERFLATGEYTQDPATVPDASRWCALASTSQDDPFAPDAGRLAFYLVTGVADGAEGSLGVRSDGAERANHTPCV